MQTRLALVLVSAASSIALASCGPTTPTPSTIPTTAFAAPTPLTSPVATTPLATTLATSPAATTFGAIDPSNFVATVDNQWFPLVPGTTLTYKGTKDGEPAVDVFRITSDTKVIDGVTCLVIKDTLTLSGKLAERTEDWYAQDREGNVWYFGEATATLDAAGKVTSTEGSWTAGVDGALPGIFMPANPQIGESMSQETYVGKAEDHFVVLLTSTPVKVLAGSYPDTLLTAEWTPLEPNVLSEKYFGKGIGTLEEVDVVGGNESLELAAIKKP
jgi:hypothetical protein